MTLTNAYCTVAQLRDAVRINDTVDDALLEAAIASASRMIDAEAGWRFWQDPTVVAREFYPTTPLQLDVDPISTTTGLVLKVDYGNDGTFGTTLTLGTDYLLLPRNAAADYPARPWTFVQIITLSNNYLPNWGMGRAGVQITAKWGWPAVPDVVQKATILQAMHIWRAQDAPFGAVELGVGGEVQRISTMLHPTAWAQIQPVSKPRTA
jgi:hypothetical protein